MNVLEPFLISLTEERVGAFFFALDPNLYDVENVQLSPAQTQFGPTPSIDVRIVLIERERATRGLNLFVSNMLSASLLEGAANLELWFELAEHQRDVAWLKNEVERTPRTSVRVGFFDTDIQEPYILKRLGDVGDDVTMTQVIKHPNSVPLAGQVTLLKLDKTNGTAFSHDVVVTSFGQTFILQK